MMRMKKTFFCLGGIFLIISLLCSCTPQRPEFLPGMKEDDQNFIWVCYDPFAYFFIYDENEDLMKGEFKTEESYHPFYMWWNRYAGTTDFYEIEDIDNFESRVCFCCESEYYDAYFELQTDIDNINFFGESLPKMRFEKMTKEEFAKKYPSIDLEEPGRTG